MSDDDRVAIYTYNTNSNPSLYDPFDGSGGEVLLTSIPSGQDHDGFIELGGNYTCPLHNEDEPGRAILSHLITLIDDTGGINIPLWETVNSAIDLAYNFGRGVPAIFVMTASADSDAPVGEGPRGPWAAKNDFNGNDGNPLDDWTIIRSYDVCNSPFNVYTFGLGISGGQSGTLGNQLNETALSSNATFDYFTDVNDLSVLYTDAVAHLLAVKEARSSRLSVTYFEDDFETDLSKWDASVTQWYIRNNEGYGPSDGAKSDKNNFGNLNSDNIDLSSALSATLKFWYKLDTSLSTDFELWFFNCTDWNLISSLGGGFQGIWLESTTVVDLAEYGNTNFRIRVTSTLGNNEFVWVDDFILSGDKDTGPASQPGPGKTEISLWGAGDRNLTTESFDLLGSTSATLSFYQKYDIKSALNGVVIQIGLPNSTGWEYKYLFPKQPYTSNFNLGYTRLDDFGNDMRWCFNGVSGYGLYTWDYIEVDLTNYTGQSDLRIRFLYMWSTWGDGGYYFIDDVKVKVTRNDTAAVTSSSADQWMYSNDDAHSGDYSWWIRNPSTGYLGAGLDNSLYTRPIDLTGARNATFSAYFKFNINASASRPPDGFRVEISSDNGVTWKAINLGVRTSWGVSGSEADADDGIPGDGKSYTGLDPDNDYWVSADTLTRLNVDISGWAGSVIQMRFRAVSASDANPDFVNHYEDGTVGFGGIYIDDIIISGFSLLG
jgi:hypothetical protein